MKAIILLWCGILSSFLYLVMNILCDVMYQGYDAASQTVSELSAVDSPVRLLWVSLAFAYSILCIAFGWGVWISGRSKWLRIAGVLLMVNAIIGIFWPPMHQREVLAAGGASITDTLHIVFTIVSTFLMMLVIISGAAGLTKSFQAYSAMTLLVMLVFGILAGLDSPKMEANLSTPMMGVWERISIGAYMAWVIIFAVAVIKYIPGPLRPISQKRY